MLAFNLCSLEGDTINVIGPFETYEDESSSVTILNKQNLLILHPDILLTATSISGAPHCTRRPILSSLLHADSVMTPSLVWGNVLHEVIQLCLVAKQWDDRFIDDRIDEILRQRLTDLVNINMGVEEAKAEIKRRTAGLKTFGRKFIGSKPKVRLISSHLLLLIHHLG